MRAILTLVLIIVLLVGGAYLLGQRAKQMRVVNTALRQGQTHVNNGNYQQAVTELTTAIQNSPKDPDLYLSRAALYKKQKQYKEALADTDTAIKLAEPLMDAEVRKETLARAYDLRNTVHQLAGDGQAAVKDQEALLKLEPENTTLINNLAWLLATCPDDKARDGKRAIELATDACKRSGYSNPVFLDTLAAAYAEDGQYDQAVHWQQQAVSRVPAGDDRNGYRRRLRMYQNHQPFREQPEP